MDMINPTSFVLESGGSLVAGYVMRFLKEIINMSHERDMAHIKLMQAYSSDADNAKKRGDNWARKLLLWALVFALVIVPVIVILFTDKGVAYPVEKTRSILWGLVKWGNDVEWQTLTSYPYIPVLLRGLNIAIFFHFGSGAAKAR